MQDVCLLVMVRGRDGRFVWVQRTLDRIHEKECVLESQIREIGKKLKD